MKRDAVAILLRPYKNELISSSSLKEAVDSFGASFIKLATEFPRMHWNLLLPGYMLERMDSIALAKLREIQKRNALEWLCCGYTEPFLSLSPIRLSQDNIREGKQLVTNLTEQHPTGFVPPFSNWEPAFVPSLVELGFTYAVLSEMLFAEEARLQRTYWATEYSGATVNIFPLCSLHPFTAPQHIDAWLANAMADSLHVNAGPKLFSIDYRIPLQALGHPDPFVWLKQLAECMEQNALTYQTVCFQEFMSSAPPCGLHYAEASLVFEKTAAHRSGAFLDHLHTFDQVGILHRRVLEIEENLRCRAPSRLIKEMYRRLFFVQDINRFLPAEKYGFLCHSDRNWTYEHIIALDEQLHKTDAVKGGQIRISDFLKNGTKCILISNGPLKMYLDHRSGGHVFELDFRYRRLNLCSIATAERHTFPCIIQPGTSATAFDNHLVDESTSIDSFAACQFVELGDFCATPFDYTIKKTRAGIRCVLMRNGSVMRKDKFIPLTLEKVFGLENDDPVLYFVYKFSTPSLLSLSFRLAVRIPLFLPGAEKGEAQVLWKGGGTKDLCAGRLCLQQMRKLQVRDQSRGVHLRLITQKPVDVWCYPIGQHSYHGTMLVLSSVVVVENHTPWMLIGKMELKKTRPKGRAADAC